MPRRSTSAISAQPAKRRELLDAYAAQLAGFAPGDYGEVLLQEGESRAVVQRWLKRAAERRLNLMLVFLSGRRAEVIFRVLTPEERAEHAARQERAQERRRETLANQERRRQMLADLAERQPPGIDALARPKRSARRGIVSSTGQPAPIRPALAASRAPAHRGRQEAPYGYRALSRGRKPGR